MRAKWVVVEEEEKKKKNEDDKYLEMRSCSRRDGGLNTDVRSGLVGALWNRDHARRVRVRSGE